MFDKKKAIWFLLGGVLMIAVVVGGAYFAYDQAFRQVDILVASEQIEAGDPISDKMLDAKKVAISAIKDYEVYTPKTFKLGLVATVPMSVGDPLRKDKCLDLEDNDLSQLPLRLAALESKGLYGVDIPVESIKGMITGEIPAIKPGAKLALEVAYKDRDPSGFEVSKAEIFVEGAPVVAVKPATENQGGSVVVALTRDEFVAYGSSVVKGKIQGAVRAFEPVSK